MRTIRNKLGGLTLLISTIITKPQSLRAHVAIKIDETSTEQDSPEMATCVGDCFPTNEQRQGVCPHAESEL